MSLAAHGVWRLDARRRIRCSLACAIRHFAHWSIFMEGLQPIHRRVVRIDVHRMLHVVTESLRTQEVNVGDGISS